MANNEYVKGQTDLSLAGTYSPSGVPASGDNLGFSEGTGLINAGMTALAARDLLSVIFRPGFSANLGESGNPVEFDCDRTSTGVVNYGGKGQWVYAKGGSTAVWNKVIWQPANGTAVLYAQNVTINTLEVYAGLVKCPSSVVVDVVKASQGGQVIIGEHASDTVGNTTVKNLSSVETRRRIAGTTSLEKGSVLIYDVDTATTSGTINMNGGTLIHIKGALTINGSSGVYDYSRLQKVYAVIITDTPALEERFGAVSPTFTRTTEGTGSIKVAG